MRPLGSLTKGSQAQEGLDGISRSAERLKLRPARDAPWDEEPCGWRLRPRLRRAKAIRALPAEATLAFRWTAVCDVCRDGPCRGPGLCDCDCGWLSPDDAGAGCSPVRCNGSTFEIASTCRKSAYISFVCLVAINPVFDWARQGLLRERAS